MGTLKQSIKDMKDSHDNITHESMRLEQENDDHLRTIDNLRHINTQLIQDINSIKNANSYLTNISTKLTHEIKDQIKIIDTLRNDINDSKEYHDNL
eukprot:CAMPEP_0114693758 /NCGR_PEP_ID=MMETSP0191-20121206/69416_1 /TAXON_ID=126664 /ORGANISM="Sorites sp." /LENGTH=95 /DNA_ID=CAMNT_0001987797 /DNA_START=789 /DNA_END=1073 /DNA_ORIENTATION=-